MKNLNCIVSGEIFDIYTTEKVCKLKVCTTDRSSIILFSVFPTTRKGEVNPLYNKLKQYKKGDVLFFYVYAYLKDNEIVLYLKNVEPCKVNK